MIGGLIREGVPRGARKLGLAGVMVAVFACPGAAQAGDVDVVKVAAPLSAPEPGGTFTFSLNISSTNPGPPSGSNLHIESITDNIYGDVMAIPGSNCSTLHDKLLSANKEAYSCSFPGTFTGPAGAKQTDTVTVVARCVGQGQCTNPTVSGSAQATVQITGPGTSPRFAFPVDCKGVFPTIIGTGLPERIFGTPGRDVVQAGPGEDTILGQAGDDRLCGAKQKDLVKGGRGDDFLNGGSRKDVCVGGRGKDEAHHCSVVRGVP
jgi:hemolysin type calcium-binding protein